MTQPPTRSQVQRLFLGWDAPALPKTAELLADHYAGSRGMDLRDVYVVTPAARAGRRLVELLLDEAEKRGEILTPPRTVTIGRFPELLYRTDAPFADPVTSRHAFAQALVSSDPKLMEPVFRVLPRKMSGWMSLAAVVERLHREVGAEGLSFKDVAQSFHRGFPYDDSVRWDVLGKVQDRYHGILRKAGVRDVDSGRRKALEIGALRAPGALWFVGVVEMPGLVRRMLGALDQKVHCLIHAPEDQQHRFDRFGCVDPERWEGAHVPLEDDVVHVVQRPADQADRVLDIVAGYEGRFSAEEVVVGVPDPELVPYVERALSLVEVPHRFAGGTPMEDTGPFRLLQAMADYLDGRPYTAFSALLRHPDLHDLFEAGSTREEDPEVTGSLTTVDRYQSDHLQAVVEPPLPGGDKHAQRTRRLVDQFHAELGLDRFGDMRPISEWMPAVLEILVRVYGDGPLDMGTRADRRLLEVLSRIKGAAIRLTTLPAGVDTRIEAPEAIRILLSELKGPANAIPPDPEAHAVELLGWLELPLDDAPAVVLTGVNDRRIPESLGADPFLPSALRSFLGLPDDRARYARDTYLLSALLHSRDSVHLVSGRLSASGDPLRPSRLLFAVPDREVAHRVLRYLGEEEGPRPPRPGVPRPSNGSRFQSPPVNPIRAPEALHRIRVTDFGSYLQDPYRYALTRILYLDELADDSREMEAMTFGSLAHLVLERFGRSPEIASTDPDVVEKKLARLLEGTVHEIFGRRPLPAVRIQARQLGARLQRFARWQANWASSGWKVRCVEQQPEPGVPFEVDGAPILLRGKIDRIDHNEETGEWAILDYKTGDPGKEPEAVHRAGPRNDKRWIDLQLPMYRRLLSGVLDGEGVAIIPEEDRANVLLGYLLLPKKLDEVGVAFAEWDQTALDDAEETARGVVRALREGEFFFDEKTRSFPGDPFDALLGRKELPSDAEGPEGGEDA